MDWRAIEDNENKLREAIAHKEAAGTDEDLLAAAAGRLQLGLIRPWLTWITAEKGNPARLMEAFTDVIAAMVAEVTANFKRSGAESMSHADFVVRVLLIIGQKAIDDAKEMDKGDYEYMQGTPIHLGKQTDA